MESEQLIQVLLRERIRITAAAVVAVRDVHSADDIFQQVVITALEKRADFHDPEHVFAWAIRASRFRGIDLARKNRLTMLPDDVLDLLEHDSIHPDKPPSERAIALQSCMSKLPLPTREMLRMRYDDGLSAGAIASRFDRSVDAVYQSISRAHRALRVCVEKELAKRLSEVNV